MDDMKAREIAKYLEGIAAVLRGHDARKCAAEGCEEPACWIGKASGESPETDYRVCENHLHLLKNAERI